MKELIIKGKFKATLSLDDEMYSINIDRRKISIGAYNPDTKGFWFDADVVCVDEFTEFTKFIDSENLSFNQEK